MLLIILAGERDRQTQRQTETSMWERNIYQLLSVHAPTRDWTRKLRYVPWPGIELITFLVYRTMLQPTEPLAKAPPPLKKNPFSSFWVLTAFQHHGRRLWVDKVESEALASGVHGPSEIVHIVLCEFWGGRKGDSAFIGFLKKCVP